MERGVPLATIARANVSSAFSSSSFDILSTKLDKKLYCLEQLLISADGDLESKDPAASSPRPAAQHFNFSFFTNLFHLSYQVSATKGGKDVYFSLF